VRHPLRGPIVSRPAGFGAEFAGARLIPVLRFCNIENDRCNSQRRTFRPVACASDIRLASVRSNKHRRRVTAYGVFSSRALGERRKQTRGEDLVAGIGATVSSYEPLTEADEFAKRKRQSWARLIQKIWEVSPLTCTRCGAEMRVVSVIVAASEITRFFIGDDTVITDPVVIDKILKHIAKKDRAPPSGHPAAS